MRSLLHTFFCFLIVYTSGAATYSDVKADIYFIAGVDSLDSVFFDLRDAVCTGPYISVPVHVKSDDDVYAIDFAIKLNVDDITFHSIQQVKPYLFQAANFNTGDSTLRFTSFSLQPVENDSDLFWVRFNKNDGYVNAMDFTNATAQLNGDFCPYKIIDTDPAPFLSVPPSVSIIPGDSVQVIVTAVAGSTYLWTNGDTSSSVIIDSAGNYGVTIFSPTSGCSSILNLTVNFAIPLPVEFGELQAFRSGKEAVVTWKTFTESGNDYFVVERSVNGLTWTDRGHLDGAGWSVIPQNYSFIDPEITASGFYYRIRQTDFDGEYSYSQVAFLNPESIIREENLSIFPNPSAEAFYVRFSPDCASVDWQLMNSAGRLVADQQSILSGDGLLTIVWPANLNSGNYIFRYKADRKSGAIPVSLIRGKN